MTQLQWVDSHHHLWDLTRVKYPWLSAKGERRFFGQPDPIRKNYLVENYIADHQFSVGESVHIQVGAEDSLQETQFIERMANTNCLHSSKQYPNAAVVAINMSVDDISEPVERQLSHDIVRGVRDIIGKSLEENKLLAPFQPKLWKKNWLLLADNSLSFDLQFTSEQYYSVLRVLEKIPELKVAICHFASPWDQSETGFKFWKTAMKQFAALPNCYMKLSGFGMFKQSFVSADFAKYAHESIHLFGPSKCMFGSNFPVDKLYMSFQELFVNWNEVVSKYNIQQASQLSSLTAREFYKL
jgi:predicted TIM-barrel fold metal-dependent hydrolase